MWVGPLAHVTNCGGTLHRHLRGGRSYLAMESPFLATGYHTTYHFGLYLYQFLYQLFLRCISPYPPYSTIFFETLS